MDLVDRLFRRLQDALQREFPGAPAPEFSIAELYQQLIPYRAVRGELGLLELAQYEHALLRLLAGERGYLRVELPEVTAELQRELASPNPILGIYRDYAAVRVGLVPPADTLPEPPRPAPARPAAAPPAAAPSRPAVMFPAPPMAPAPPPATAQPPPPARAEHPAPACHRCQAPLPDAPDLRFCPHCGAGQAVPCTECGLALKPEWNFCIRCGTPRQGRRRTP